MGICELISHRGGLGGNQSLVLCWLRTRILYTDESK